MSTTKKSTRKSTKSAASRKRTTAGRKTNRTSKKACTPPNRFFCGLTVAIICVAATAFITTLTMFALAGSYKVQDAAAVKNSESSQSVDANADCQDSCEKSN